MQNDKREAMRKAEAFVRGLVERNGNGVLVTSRVVNYLETTGYDEAFHDELLKEGLRQHALRLISRFTQPRNPERQGSPMGSTAADKNDIEAMAEQGVIINRGSPIHKSLLACSARQLKEVLNRILKGITPRIKDACYVAELYKLRTGKQLVLPFDIPVKIQLEMKALAEKDLGS
jgi:hypothetical protein